MTSNTWSEDAAREIASRCLNRNENGITLDVLWAATIIRAAHTMQFGGEWEYCKPCQAGEYWNGKEWKPIGTASVGRFESQAISRNHRRLIRDD